MSGGNGGPGPLGPMRLPTTRQGAEAEFNRIMAGAATFQQLINFHVVNSARNSNPAVKAQELDAAIRAAERMAGEFRRARELFSVLAPKLTLPDLPPAPQFGPTTKMPEKQVPRRF